MCDKTIAYYNVNATDFAKGTVAVDFEQLQTKFTEKLPEGGYILDFGCGSGRDTKYFLEQGYQVDAIDGSEELCKFASEYTGIPVKHMYFEDLEEEDKYDGIWACASILHLSLDDLKYGDVFWNIEKALKDGGVLYVSFKYGTFEGERNGRYFTDMTEETFKKLMEYVLFDMDIDELWITTDARPGREERWLNVILRKKQCKKLRQMLKEHSDIMKNYFQTQNRKNYVEGLIRHEKKYKDLYGDIDDGKIYLDIAHYSFLEKEYEVSKKYLSQYARCQKNFDYKSDGAYIYQQMDVLYWFDMAQLCFLEGQENEAVQNLRKCLQYHEIPIDEVFEFYECLEQWESCVPYVAEEEKAYRMVYEEFLEKLEEKANKNAGQEDSLLLEKILQIEDEEKFTIAYTEYLYEKCDYGDATDKLSEEEKIVYYVDVLNQEVHSGGFESYYTSECGYVPDIEWLRQAFAAIKATKAWKIVESTFAKFPDGRLPLTVEERDDLIEQSGIDFEAEDEQFYEYPDNLEKLIAEFVRNSSL